MQTFRIFKTSEVLLAIKYLNVKSMWFCGQNVSLPFCGLKYSRSNYPTLACVILHEENTGYNLPMQGRWSYGSLPVMPKVSSLHGWLQILEAVKIRLKGSPNVINSSDLCLISSDFAICVSFIKPYQWCRICRQSLCRNMWPQFVYIAILLYWDINT